MSHTRRLIYGVLSLVIIFVGWIPGEASGRGASRPAPSAPSGVSFFDDFDSSTLAGGWTWVREDNTEWSLTDRPGFLRIDTAEGTLDDSSTADNILRRAIPGEDLEVETRVEIDVTQDFHEASLMLYTGDSNFIKISRVFKSDQGGAVFFMRREVAGVGVGAFHSSVVTTTVAGLRLRFVAPWVIGYYDDGSGNWTPLGEYNVGSTTYNAVALAAHHGFPDTAPASITADFDFLRIAGLESLYLPLIQR